MDTTVLVAVIGFMQAIGVAVIGGIITRNRNKDEETRRMREERDTALYALVFANAGGTEVLLHKAHGDSVNGNVDEALSSIHDAKAKFNNVCNKQAARLGG